MVSAPRCPPGARGLLALLLLLPLPGARGQCSSPPSFSFAQLSSPVRSIYPVGYRLRYSCRQGYTLDPRKSPVTCGANSTWLIDPEFCVGRPCKPLELENGRVDLTDLRFGATATFSCNEGYKIIGPTSAQCVIAGNGVDWDKEVPLCQEIRCPSPDITNGKAIPRKETYVYEDKIRIECNPGYALKDKNGLIKCEHNRAWHPPLPICEPACEPPARISNGWDDRGWRNVFLVGSSVTYDCDRGWSLVGVSSIRCTAGDEGIPRWNAPVPQCKACEPPARISNGRDDRGWRNVFLVGSSVTYDCDRGWSLVGVASIRCTAGDGGTPRWDAPVPECKACEPPARISNGRDDRGWENVFLVGSSVSYSCNRGWSLVGVSSIRCTAGDGGTPRWDAPVPECKEFPRCPNPVIEHGKQISIRQTEYTIGNRVEFQCESGYILEGSKSIECQSNKTWNPRVPSCVKACEPPARISNGWDDRGWRNVFLVGSSVTYDCDRGWSLVGVASIRCTAGDGGTPRWNAPVPQCKACEPTARIANGWDNRGRKNVFLVGSSVSFSCDHGWSLVGVASIRCTAGDGGTPRWNAPVPECKEIPRCPNPVIEHGKQISIRETEYTVGNRIEFQCESGYILEGSKSIECQSNKTWNPRVPSCVKGEGN